MTMINMTNDAGGSREQAALAAALPAMDALANAQRDDPLVGQT